VFTAFKKINKERKKSEKRGGKREKRKVKDKKGKLMEAFGSGWGSEPSLFNK